MITNKLSDLSLEEIQTKKKKLQGVVIGLGIVLLVACATLIYLAFQNKNYSLIPIAIACLLTMVPSIIVLGQCIKEIKSRSFDSNKST